MLTNKQQARTPKAVSGQEDTYDVSQRVGGNPHLRVKQGRKPKRGGWQATRYIDHATYRACRADAGYLARLGFRLNVLATVSPPDGLSDAQAKRWAGLQLDRLGQALERCGHPYVALKVYEKPEGGRLHAHALIFVAPAQFHVVERWADRFDKTKPSRTRAKEAVCKHACRADAKALLYVLKQHRWAGPQGEKYRVFYQKSEALPGPRVTFTKATRALITESERLCASLEAVEPMAAATAQPVLPLPGEVLDLTALVEAKRRALGLSQAALGARLGIKQAGYSNAFVRRHDKPGPWVVQRAVEFLSMGSAA